LKKIVLLATEPEIDPRTYKIYATLKKYGYLPEILYPKVKTRKGGRVISGLLRYIVYMLQISISKADLYWVANAPDIVAIPLFTLKRKYVYDFRSVWSKEMEAEFGKTIWSHLARIIETLAMKNAKIIVLNSDTLLKDAKPYNKPLFLIPNYPLKNFKPTVPRQKFRQIHGATEDSKIVLYVGRLSRVEGADLIPNLIKELSKHNTIKLWIVGGGPFQDLMKRLQKKHPENMKYFGWQPYNQIPNFINASDVCIVPRHRDYNSPYYNEKGVLKISEYMLFKKPIVCSGIAPSNQYLLLEEDNLVHGILEALKGNAPIPTPKTWEEDAELELLTTLKTAFENQNC
jgi:glycosyltransferase involved in cell wall biosynthesis